MKLSGFSGVPLCALRALWQKLQLFRSILIKSFQGEWLLQVLSIGSVQLFVNSSGALSLSPETGQATSLLQSATINSCEEESRCPSLLSTATQGDCFVAGTLVTLSSLPESSERELTLWTEKPLQEDLPTLSQALKENHFLDGSIKVSIEQVPLGARVPSKNPRPWEFDNAFDEPDENNWSKVTLAIQQDDGGWLDAELIRPKHWFEELDIRNGILLPLNIPELQIVGLARILSLEPCPPIAVGRGSVVISRFKIREVTTIIEAKIRTASGSLESIQGTSVHPMWSVSRNNWTPLGELAVGEELKGCEGIAVVCSIATEACQQPAYNIEVHGEHVYEIGNARVLVHNGCESNSVLKIGPRPHALEIGIFSDQFDVVGEIFC